MNKLRDAIYGFAVADALGVPYEFRPRGTFKCTDMVEYGTWNQPKGMWSDDTSMTLATCRSIKDNKKLFKLMCDKPELFNGEKTFRKLYEEIFQPILSIFSVPKEEQ